MGDTIYRQMSVRDKFTPDNLLNHLRLSSEHEALEVADRVEASMYTWRRKACLSHSKSSWAKVKDLMSESDRTDKNYVLAERADTLLFCLKHRFPELSQTSLDTSKIQFNRVSLLTSFQLFPMAAFTNGNIMKLGILCCTVRCWCRCWWGLHGSHLSEPSLAPC